jgi:phosphoserine phosphatase RsbU/P
MSIQSPDEIKMHRLQEENNRLKRAVEELTILNDLARAIGAKNNSDDIMQIIIRRSLKAVDAEQGVITLVDNKTDDSMKTLVRTMVSSSENQPFRLNQNLLGWMHINKKPLVVNDPATDTRFRGVRWDEALNSLLCVPLIVKSQLIGILTVYNKKHGAKFSDEDQRLLAILASQSAQIVENARLYEEEQAYMKMRQEVQVAAKIQLNLLPEAAPQIEGYDIAGKSEPAQIVGGDYYDFIPYDDRHLAFCLADVAGKGLSASLLMANLQATLRGQSFLTTSAKECVEKSNKLLVHNTSAERFVTCFYAVLDAENHEVCFSNAGHDPPILIKTGNEPARLETGNLVLGMLDTFPYDEKKITLQSNDLIVVYSDGVTEAKNDRDEEFGEQRLIALVEQCRQESASVIIDTIFNAVKKHMDKQPAMDDITLVVVKRL